MAIGPRQQLYIAGGIAAFFAVMMILFIILFATKHCDSCSAQLSGNDVGTVLTQMPNTARDAGAIQEAFEKAGYSIFKISNLPATDKSQAMAIVTYQPPDDAVTVSNKIKSSTNQPLQVIGDNSPQTLACATNDVNNSSSTVTIPFTTTAVPSTSQASSTPISSTCPPPAPSLCSSTVKDVIFAIDLLPDIQGSAQKFSQISNVLTKFGQTITFGDTATRIGIIGFDNSQTSTGFNIYNSQGDYNNAVRNIIGKAATNRPSSSWANIGSAFRTISQYADQLRAVDKVILVISDHAPVSIDSSGNGPSSTGAATLASSLRQKQFYVGALTPVPSFMTMIWSGYNSSIVSNFQLFNKNVKGYDDGNFEKEVENFFLRNICGYVNDPSIPPPQTTTTLATTTTTKRASTTPYTGPSTSPPTGSSAPPSSSTPNGSPSTSLSTPSIPPSPSPSTTMQPSTSTPVPTDTNKCQTIDILFILDRSQSIDSAYYNNDVRKFVQYIGGSFSMTGEATTDFPNALGRVGVIQFSDSVKISMELKSRTREQFISDSNSNIVYDNGGTTKLSDALQAAVSYLNSGVTATNNLITVLVTDGVSTPDIIEAEPYAAQLRAKVHMFMGVGIPGINGNQIAANTSNLVFLLGNKTDYAFPNIAAAEAASSGILPDSLKVYPCPSVACKGVIFIGEMTEVIAQERKELFLNATMQIAANIYANPGGATTQDQLRFGLALYGSEIYRYSQLQSYSDFRDTVDAEIRKLISDNMPNGGQTYTAPILRDLIRILNSGQLKNYAVLFMGETERMLDHTDALGAARTIANSGAQIFVLDMTTEKFDQNDVFSTLVNGDQSRKLNYTGQSQSDLITYYNERLTPVFSNLTCTAPPIGICTNLFDMVFAIDQANYDQQESDIKNVALFYNKAFIASNAYGQMTQRGIFEYSVGGNPVYSEELTFNTDLIADDIKNKLSVNPASGHVYDSILPSIQKMLTRCGKTRDYAQKIVLYISTYYPVATDTACTQLNTTIQNLIYTNPVQAPYIYYISLSKQPDNSKPCPAFDGVFTINYTDDDVNNIPQMNPIVGQICYNSPQRPAPPCTCTNTGSCSQKRSFFQRYMEF